MHEFLQVLNTFYGLGLPVYTLIFQESTLKPRISSSLVDIGPGLVLLSMSEPKERRGWRVGPLCLGVREGDGIFCPRGPNGSDGQMRTRNSRSEQQTGSGLDKY